MKKLTNYNLEFSYTDESGETVSYEYQPLSDFSEQAKKLEQLIDKLRLSKCERKQLREGITALLDTVTVDLCIEHRT